MKCMHCGTQLPENSVKCASCGKAPSVPDGFVPDAETGLYTLTATGSDAKSGEPIKVVTRFNPDDGSYSQEIFPAETEQKSDGEQEAKPETNPEPEQPAPKHPEPQPEPNAEPNAAIIPQEPVTDAPVEPVSMAEPQPEPEHSEPPQSELQPEPIAESNTAATPHEPAPDAPDEPVSTDEPQPEPEQSEPPKSELQPAPIAESNTAATPQEPAPDAPVEPVSTAEPKPEPEQSEPQSEPHPEAEQRPKKKRRAGVFVAVFILMLLGGGFAAAYYYGLIQNFIVNPDEIIAMTEIRDNTSPPEGAAVPAFLPVEPPKPLPEELVTPPADEVSLEVSESPDVQETQPSASDDAVNYYPALANVSQFCSRAIQDEGYIYYLPAVTSGKLTDPADLMRVSIGSDTPEYVKSFWPNTGSVYAFTLYEDEIIVCARKPDSPAYGFYRAPKSGGDASFMFEKESPSLMTVYDGRLFMLFTASRQAGVFDLKKDSIPTFIDLPVDTGAELLPAFSVVDGDLYYGVSYNGGERAEYMRRSLYTGETVAALSSSGLNEPWIADPVWDDDGNAYYGQFNGGTKIFSFKRYKPGGAPESLFSFTVSDGLTPFSGAFGKEGILTMTAAESLRKYRLDNFTVERDIDLEGRPYAVTNDYLVARNGYYLIADFSWIPFEAPASLS